MYILDFWEGTMGQNWKKKHRIASLSYERGSEWSERASEGSEPSSAEQAYEWAVGANKRTDKRVAQYSNLYSWLFWPTVEGYHLGLGSPMACLGSQVKAIVTAYRTPRLTEKANIMAFWTNSFKNIFLGRNQLAIATASLNQRELTSSYSNISKKIQYKLKIADFPP